MAAFLFMKQARSTIALENIEEVIEAESSPEWATLAGQQQYFTPDTLAAYCRQFLPAQNPATVIDPQCGGGGLLKELGGWGTTRYGLDIDNRIEGTGWRFMNTQFMKFKEVLDELYPDLRWVCGNANPPFGKRWPDGKGGVIDSTLATWNFLIERCSYGHFISNQKTIERLGIDKHPFVYRYETKADVWPQCEVVIGIVWYKNPAEPRVSNYSELDAAWMKLKEILAEEMQNRPKFNIYLDHKGYLQTYLSVRTTVKRKLTREQILRLHRVKGTHPLTLTTEEETRDLMQELVTCGLYTIEAVAEKAIHDALAEVSKVSCPIMPVTDFETVAYADEEETLECITTVRNERMEFTAGRRYKLSTGTYKFIEKFQRNKVHFDEERSQMFTRQHDCTLSGQDRYIAILDDKGNIRRFMDKPQRESSDLDESILWHIFKKPVVRTVVEVTPTLFEQNLAVLHSCELLAGYGYYQGQLPYLARVACKGYGLVAGATGTGKTLMAISLLAMKGLKRALIIAPQGTMRSSDCAEEEDEEEAEEYNASQWVSEIAKFVPYLQVWELFSEADYLRIKSQNGGELPPGVYITYYQAMFLNGARESAPQNWDDAKLNKLLSREEWGPIAKLPSMAEDERYWCDSIGKEVNGIRCILHPCLATKVGHLFDMVMLDEAHLCTNLEANVTQMMIRLQPRYRYALTATPIPNIVSNLFSLAGWLAVENWYLGGLRNAAWPYAREELGKFNGTFLSEERDLTQEQMNTQRDRDWRGKCVKKAPVISSPARLLKLIKPFMAYISKKECNPDYEEPKIVDVRVPMGVEQSKLYAHFLNRGNVPGRHPLVRARRQTAYLRAICADPAGFEKGGPKVHSNLNPKVIATLELVRDILSQGEQVVIISARVGLTNTLERYLTEAGVSIARIDSTISPANHSYQANLFKKKKAQVMLMGIKCAAAHSFSQCKYEIITSLEYSNGPFDQAKGRVDRVNSRPGVTIYCILHQRSIEETMFDVVATKQDAATICLLGKRIPRDFKPVDMSEVLANSISRFDVSGATPESECELAWPKLRDAIRGGLIYV
jgi:SNF2 family DNA or RNA helicase